VTGAHKGLAPQWRGAFVCSTVNLITDKIDYIVMLANTARARRVERVSMCCRIVTSVLGLILVIGALGCYSEPYSPPVYNCKMHAVELDKPGKCPKCGMPLFRRI
jgi:hypothetical protein